LPCAIKLRSLKVKHSALSSRKIMCSNACGGQTRVTESDQMGGA